MHAVVRRTQGREDERHRAAGRWMFYARRILSHSHHTTLRIDSRIPLSGSLVLLLCGGLYEDCVGEQGERIL